MTLFKENMEIVKENHGKWLASDFSKNAGVIFNKF
jgi:hypothetical protein